MTYNKKKEYKKPEMEVHGNLKKITNQSPKGNMAPDGDTYIHS